MLFKTTFIVMVFFLLESILSNPVDLGEKDHEEFGRIVNGRPAKLGEFPYQVSLQIRPFGYPFCGGASLGNNWVATAAHCVRTKDPKEIQVVMGAINLKDTHNPIFNVEKIVWHPYDDETKVGDVALLKVASVQPHDEYRSLHPLGRIDMVDEKLNLEGRTCFVSGWGHLRSKSYGGANELQVVDVRMISKDGCKEMLEGLPWNETTMICAGGRDKDACQGDSGGPLVCPDDDNRLYLSGIVSWGVGCATEGVPGVYTKIVHYKDWMLDVMEKE